MKKVIYKNIYCGVEYNPFTRLYDDVYSQEECVVDVSPPVHQREVYYSDKKDISRTILEFKSIKENDMEMNCTHISRTILEFKY